MGLFKFLKRIFTCSCCSVTEPSAKDKPIVKPLEKPILQDKKEELPWCKFGINCYRKNPEHFRKYRHHEKIILNSPVKIPRDVLVKPPLVVKRLDESLDHLKVIDLNPGPLLFNSMKFYIVKNNYIDTEEYKFNCNSHKQRQLIINDIIRQVFHTEDILFDKRLSSRVNKRPDWLIRKNNFVLIVECDETQHRHIKLVVEFERMIEIQKDINLPCIFLRFNPDGFRVNGMKDECEFIKRDGLLVTTEKFNQRMRVLLTRIEHYLLPKSDSIKLNHDITVEFLFFDTR